VLLAKIEEEKAAQVTPDMLRAAAATAGLAFTDQQLDKMLAGVNKHLAEYVALHQIELDNSVAPPFYFSPLVPGSRIDRTKRPFRPSETARVTRPKNLADAAFWQ